MDNITYRVDAATAFDLVMLFEYFEESDLREAFRRTDVSSCVTVPRAIHTHLLRFFEKLTLDDVHRAFRDCPADTLEAKSDRVYCFYFNVARAADKGDGE